MAGETDFTFSTDGGPHSQPAGFSERRYERMSHQVQQLPLIRRANTGAPKGAALLSYRAGTPSLTETSAGGCTTLRFTKQLAKGKRNVHFSPTCCSVITSDVATVGSELETEWPHSGCLLSVDVTLVMYRIPPTHSEITPRLSVELVFHIARARWLANLQLLQTTARALPLPPLGVFSH